MMPGSKGLSPHKLARKWVKDLMTPTSNIFYKLPICLFVPTDYFQPIQLIFIQRMNNSLLNKEQSKRHPQPLGAF